MNSPRLGPDESATASPRRPPQPDAQAVLAAQAELLAAAEQMEQALAVVRDRSAVIRACIAEGEPFQQIVARLARPLGGEVLPDALGRLEAASTRGRRVLATALRREGLTMQQVGDLWGISRQRISELLQATDRPTDE